MRTAAPVPEPSQPPQPLPPRVVRLRLRRRARRVRLVLGRAGLAGVAAASLVAVPAVTLERRERPITEQEVALAAPAGAPWPGAGQGTGMFLPVPEAGVQADSPASTSAGTAPGGNGQAAVPPPALQEGAAFSRGIPSLVLDAYRRAAGSLAVTDSGCGLPWWLLAGIGRIESGQASGGRVDPAGTTRGVILGPRLDGSLGGTAVIRDTDGGSLDGDPVFDRAVGPMQFLPGTWRAYGVDGNGDGRADPSNVYDAALTAGRYLCASGGDLRTPTGLAMAVLSYNYSTSYLSAVLGWGLAYRDGVWSSALSGGTVPSPPAAAPTGRSAPTTVPTSRATTAPATTAPTTTAPTTTAPTTKTPAPSKPTGSGTSKPTTSTTSTPTTAPTASTTSQPTASTSTTTSPPSTSTNSTTASPPSTSPPTTSTSTTASPPTTSPPTTSTTTPTSVPTASTTTAAPTTTAPAPQPSTPTCLPSADPTDPSTGLLPPTRTAPSSAPTATDGPSPSPDPGCTSPATPPDGGPRPPGVSPTTRALADLP